MVVLISVGMTRCRKNRRFQVVAKRIIRRVVVLCLVFQWIDVLARSIKLTMEQGYVGYLGPRVSAGERK